MSKKTKIILITLFLAIFGIKAYLTTFIYVPIILPDEGCILSTSKYLAEHGKLVNCSDTTNLPNGNPPPLIPIIFSVFYLLLAPLKAYKAILIFHSLIVSALIFPLYILFKKFIKDNRYIYPTISFLLFIPQIFAYEKTVMSEALFFVTNIWIIHFYLKHFETQKVKFKIITYFLAVIAIFLRPFGFISLAAIVFNEFMQSKNKIKGSIILISGFIGISLTVKFFRPEAIDSYLKLILSLFNPDLYIITINALTNQINSIIAATVLIPSIFFALKYFEKKESKYWQKIKFFILGIVLLNIFISTLTLFKYYLDSYGIGISTRYINISIILIYTFGTIGILEHITQNKKNNRNLLILGIIFASSLLTLNYGRDNLQLIYEYLHLNLWEIPFFQNYFIPITGILLFGLYINKNRAILIAIILVNTFHTVTGFTVTAMTSKNLLQYNGLYQDLKNEQYKILYLVKFGELEPSTFWALKNLTNNDVTLSLFDFQNGEIQLLQIMEENKDKAIDTSKFDYAITDQNVNLNMKKAIVSIEGILYQLK